jgi:hypothetical protein
VDLLRAFRRPSRRTPHLPALPLEHGERVLAWATDGAGLWYAGTARALLLSSRTESRRLPWESIERAEWDGDTAQLEVVELAEFGQPKPVHRAALQEPERLLQLVRERITASIVVSRFVPVAGNRGITVVARRAPHTAEELTWSCVVDPGLDEDSPQVRAAFERGLAEARGEIGE